MPEKGMTRSDAMERLKELGTTRMAGGQPRVIAEACGDQGMVTVAEVEELYGHKGRFRVLQFADGAVQGALDLDDPDRVLLEYPRAMAHLLELNCKPLEQVFLIGLGIGTIPRRFPGCRFIAAELNAQVVELSRRYFGCEADSVRIGDGRAVLEAQAEDFFDAVILDAFTASGTPRHLLTLEFFRMAAMKLIADGLLLVNLFGRGSRDPAIGAVYATMSEVFGYTAAFALPSDAAAERNILLAGSRKPVTYRGRELAGFGILHPVPGYVLLDVPSKGDGV